MKMFAPYLPFVTSWSFEPDMFYASPIQRFVACLRGCKAPVSSAASQSTAVEVFVRRSRAAEYCVQRTSAGAKLRIPPLKAPI